MKQLYLKSFLLMIFVSAQMQIMAKVTVLPRPEGLTQIEGLYYYLDDNTMTAEVTYAGVHVEKYKPIEGSTKVISGEWIVQDQYISGDVAIPSTVTNEGKSYTVTKIGSSAFSEQSVTSIIVPSTVTSIGANAFSSTSSLLSIKFFSTNPPVLEDNAFTNIGASAIIFVDEKYVNIYKSTEGWKDMDISTFNSQCTLNGIIYGIDGTTAYVKGVSSYNIKTADILSKIEYEGRGLDVTGIGDWAFNNCIDLTSVIIPTSVTSIGNMAFIGCRSLASVEIPNSVASIGILVFSGCSNLSSPVYNSSFFIFSPSSYSGEYAIPEGIKEVCPSAFSGCSSLTSVTIPNSVETIGASAFSGCSGLSSVTISKGITSIGSGAFEGCDGLKTVTLDNDLLVSAARSSSTSFSTIFGTQVENYILGEKVTGIGAYAFSNCSGLTSMTIPYSVVTIGEGAFSGCEKLKTVTLDNDLLVSASRSSSSSFSTIFGNQVEEYILGENVSSIGAYAFYGCSNLISVNIPNNIKSIGDNAFNGCSGLTSVTLPNSITSIGGGAFSGCSSLTSVNLPNSVTSIGRVAFYGCNSLTSPLYNSKLFACLPTSYNGEYSIPEGIEEICAGAFWTCKSLISVNIPSSMKSIDEGAFYGCSGLTSVNIPSSMKSIGNSAFYGCSNLTSVTIPNSVTSISNNAFSGCTNLTSLTLGNGVTESDASVFKACGSLTSVTLDNNAIASAAYTWEKSMKDIFGSQVTTYVLGNNVTSIGDYAFCGCSDLKSVTIPSSVTSIGYNAFSGCNGLNSVHITDLEAWCNISFRWWGNPLEYAQCLFLNDKEITDLVIPNSVTTIGLYAFYGYSGLTSVTIPNSVTIIGDEAFSGCSGSTSITVADNLAAVGSDAFGKATIYTKAGNKSLLTLWNAGCDVHDVSTRSIIKKPTLEFTDITQTTAVMNVKNMYKGYTYSYNDEAPIKSEKTKLTGLKPEWTQVVKWKVSLDDVSYTFEDAKFETAGIEPTMNISTTASSITADVSYSKGDAKVVGQTFAFLYGDTIPFSGHTYKTRGLRPDHDYDVKYMVEVEYGDGERAFYSTDWQEAKTLSLQLKALRPKVVSTGNVVVAANTNVDSEEENIGFEWRKTDAPDDMPSKNGYGAIYKGQIEAVIKNLDASSYYRARPFYKSDAGIVYYGSWIAFDPSDFSYCDPTVHTYDNIVVRGNEAQLSGYVTDGTDDILEQGFEVWVFIITDGAKQRRVGKTGEVMTIQTTGQRMTTTLTGLEYNTTYVCRSYAKTSTQTYYGEEILFTTDDNPTGIEDIIADEGSAVSRTLHGIYTLQGVKVSDDASDLKTLPKGIYIVNGKKVLVK